MSVTTDVLVVGAGPVGLFMANELRRHGLECRIIDKKETLSVQSKALGIHIRTLEVLAQTDFLQEVTKQGHKVHGGLIYAEGKNVIDATFDDLEAPFDYLIDLPQNQTEAIFAAGLEKKGVTVEWQTELLKLDQTQFEAIATVKTPTGETETITANWVIACDGSHSTLRHLYNVEFVGSPYKEHWWLVDAFVEWKQPHDRMVVFLAKFGPIAFFPMNQHRYRVVVAAPPEGPDQPTFEDIQKYLSTYCSEKLIIRDPIWISGFNLQHRQIQQYRHQRVFFAGDAAHIHSPIGGQGMNTGIQDVYNLAWKLALVQRGAAHASFLDSYHAERHPVGEGVLHDTDRMTKMMLLKNSVATHLRNHFMHFMTSFAPIRRKIATSMAELAVNYEKSPWVKQNGHLQVKAGDLLPCVSVMNPESEAIVSLLEVASGTQHHLFLWVGQMSDLTTALTLVREIKHHYGKWIQVHFIEGDEPAAMKAGIGHAWSDPGFQAHHHLGIKNPSLMLVRPDQYIGYLQTSLDSQPLNAYLKTIFI